LFHRPVAYQPRQRHHDRGCLGDYTEGVDVTDHRGLPLSVTTQAISLRVVDSAPRIWRETMLAKVMVIPNSRFDSYTASRINHCRAVMLRNPGLPEIVLIC
jgi:hypothetical protein